MLTSAIVVLGAFLGISDVDARAAPFRRVLDGLFARKELAGATVGCEVRSLSRGTSLYALREHTTLIPASNLKLLTLALALSTLGEQHEFETPLIATGKVDAEGVLHGDLWVLGSGDPSLSPVFFATSREDAALAPFVQGLKQWKITAVTGDLIVDDRVFDQEFVCPDWPQDQLDLDYCAPVGGLSLNGNCVDVLVASGNRGPPSVRLSPESDGLRLCSELKVSTKAREFQVSVLRPNARGEVVARGRVGPEVGSTGCRVPVTDPALYFGGALSAALRREHVQVRGSVRRPLAEEILDRDAARLLVAHRSPLIPALVRMGKESDNFIADTLLKVCAHARGRTGSFAEGERLAFEFLRSLGHETDELQIRDGSGLARTNGMTPSALVSVLAHAYASEYRDSFLRCLPISGVDGTLEKRMTKETMRYRVRAKTGYIRQVSALSGYAMAGSRETPEIVAFSILINGFRGSNAEMKQIQDAVCEAILELSP